MEKNKGFVILYAVIITTVVLIVGVSLMNIMTKQLVLSSISRSAKISYYASLSGRACAEFWKGVIPSRNNDTYFGGYDELNAWETPVNLQRIICNGQPIQPVRVPNTMGDIVNGEIVEDDIKFHFDIDVGNQGGGNQVVSSEVTIRTVLLRGCTQRQLVIISEGYNVEYDKITDPNNRLVRSIYKDKDILGVACGNVINANSIQ